MRGKQVVGFVSFPNRWHVCGISSMFPGWEWRLKRSPRNAVQLKPVTRIPSEGAMIETLWSRVNRKVEIEQSIDSNILIFSKNRAPSLCIALQSHPRGFYLVFVQHENELWFINVQQQSITREAALHCPKIVGNPKIHHRCRECLQKRPTVSVTVQRLKVHLSVTSNKTRSWTGRAKEPSPSCRFGSNFVPHCQHF